MDEKAILPLRLLIALPAQSRLPDWQAMLIDRLIKDPLIEPVVLKEESEAKPPEHQSSLLRAILFLERLAVGRRILAYDKRKAQTQSIDLPVFGTQGVSCVDLVLDFGLQDATAYHFSIARLGVWTVTFGGARNALTAALTSVQRASAGMIVQILSRAAPNAKPTVVKSAQYNQKPGAILTAAFVEEKSLLLIERALHDLALGRTIREHSVSPISALQPVGTIEALAYAVSFLRSGFAKLHEKWRVRRGSALTFWRLSAGVGDVIDMEPRAATALPALRHTMADPFLFQDGEKTWVFYEAMDADESAGWIEVAEFDGETLHSPATALRCHYHLSFPFVFRDGDDIFMLPETQQSRRLEVWRATEFPTKWVIHSTGFEGMYLADSSLWKAPDMQWWLLTNVSDHYAFQDHSSELYLFAVDGPSLGSATPHPRNPVAIGADHARNAGSLVSRNGRLFRPSQNNSFGIYGYGLNLMEITLLNGSEYEETLVRRWTADDLPAAQGIHHLSEAGGRYVFDWLGS